MINVAPPASRSPSDRFILASLSTLVYYASACNFCWWPTFKLTRCVRVGFWVVVFFAVANKQWAPNSCIEQNAKLSPKDRLCDSSSYYDLHGQDLNVSDASYPRWKTQTRSNTSRLNSVHFLFTFWSILISVLWSKVRWPFTQNNHWCLSRSDGTSATFFFFCLLDFVCFRFQEQ